VVSNSSFYQNAYKKHGISARGLNWSSEDSQNIRFKIITHFLRDKLSTCSIVDAGCGFGDLYLFWQDMGLHVKSYVGIECMNDFVDISKKRVSNCVFTCRDILKDELIYADWYVASGSLNILTSFETWLFLEKMLMYSKEGIIFNILEGDKKSENFNYQKKEDIIRFVKQKGFTCKVVEGYLQNDITMEIKK